MTLPLVSILLPFRNAERTIDRCLESIIGQCLRDWELIAVDDGSTDKSYEIIGSYAQTDSRIKLHSSKGNGIVDALNQGISVSLSHLIARMDADDVMHPQANEAVRIFVKKSRSWCSCIKSYLFKGKIKRFRKRI